MITFYLWADVSYSSVIHGILVKEIVIFLVAEFFLQNDILN